MWQPSKIISVAYAQHKMYQVQATITDTCDDRGVSPEPPSKVVSHMYDVVM